MVGMPVPILPVCSGMGILPVSEQTGRTDMRIVHMYPKHSHKQTVPVYQKFHVEQHKLNTF